GNLTSAFYTIKVDVAVEDEDGNLSTSTLTYRIDNNQSHLLNDRYAAQSVTGDATLVTPTNSQALPRAILVDANGNELPKTNGEYIDSQSGFLKIMATGSTNVIAIDSMDSAELGQPESDPAVEGTNRGFSYFFGLNNFFKESDSSNQIAGSAFNLQIEQR